MVAGKKKATGGIARWLGGNWEEERAIRPVGGVASSRERSPGGGV
ncbi:hypothetical protein MGWOODY_Hyp236 [hydrothermal vent metagenome]|uniref:Uncharacterized protein n=1 Tax=hydrothermal vent metagenome TaxID=652676 RepID=A0A160U2K1_9ZZZZ